MEQSGMARGQQPPSQQQGMADTSIDALSKSVEEWAQKTLEVANQAKAVAPDLMGYIAKAAEIGAAIQEGVKKLKERGSSGATPPASNGQAGPTPTDGTPGV